jgi:hypothetical protein
VKIVPAGDRAVLVELGDVTAAELHAAAAEWALKARACIVGHSSLYVIDPAGDDGTCGTDRTDGTYGLPVVGQTLLSVRRHTIRVSFDGDDLPELLARIGLTREAFRAEAAKLKLTARYLGFRGGFAYLDGWPEAWAMPRRPTSRPVRRGAFAVAGNVAGFYPLDTPGGWNLLGHTDDVPRIAAGDEITISPTYDVDLSAPLGVLVRKADYSKLTYGDPAGGPFDEAAAAAANTAVGNAEKAPLLECAMTGPRIVARERCVAAWADPELNVKVRELNAGDDWTIGRITNGMRGYLAIGQTQGATGPNRKSEIGNRKSIHVMAGPHDVGLRDVECEVTPQLNRVGIRLRPLQPLGIEAPADLRSCGMQCGTVQLHPDGTLVAMGPDHPVTGGYLQPMTVLSGERWKLAQLAPGERVRFITGE